MASILIIDDNDPVREVLVLTVRDKGWGRIRWLTNAQLQRLLDEAKRNAGVGLGTTHKE